MSKVPFPTQKVGPSSVTAKHHAWLRAAAQRSHRTADAAPVIIEAVERAEMDPERADINELLK